MQRCYGPGPDEKVEFSYEDVHHLCEHAQVLVNLLMVDQINWIGGRNVKVGEIEALYEELNKIKDHVDAGIFERMSGEKLVEACHLHKEAKQCD